MAELEPELEAQAQALAQQRYQQIKAQMQQPVDFKEGLLTRAPEALLSGVDSITWGMAPRAISALTAIGKAPFTDKTLGQEYSDALNLYDASVADWRRDYPKTSLVTDVTAAIAPALLTGGASVAAGAAKASGTVAKKTLSQALLSSAKAAPGAAVRAAGTGALYGGVYGFNSGRDTLGNMLEKGGEGALGGAILGPLFSAGAGAVKGAVNLGSRMYNSAPVQSLLASKAETAALDAGGLSTAEKIFSSTLPKAMTPDELRTAAEALKTSEAPLWADSVINDQGFTLGMNKIAQSPEAAGVIQRAIKDREAQKLGRLSTALDTVAPESSFQSAAEKLKAVSGKIQSDEERARTLATSPDFKAAFEVPTPTKPAPVAPEVAAEITRLQEAKGSAEASLKAMEASGIYNPKTYAAAQKKVSDLEDKIQRVSSEAQGELPASPALQRLLNTEMAQKAIRHIRNNATEAEVASLPDYHPEMIQRVLQDLSKRMKAAITAEDRVNIPIIGKIMDGLEKELKDFNPLLLAAREKYANLSERVNYLSDSQIEVLSELASDNAAGAARTMFSKVSPERIAALRQEFIKSKNGPAWDSFVRGHIYNVFSSKADNADTVRSLIKHADMREKLKAAIGENGWQKLYKRLSDEALIHESKLGMAMGSQTEPRFNIGEDIAGAVLSPTGVMGKLKTVANGWNILSAEHPEEIRQAAEIFVDPKRSADLLEKIAAAKEAKTYSGKSNLSAILQAQQNAEAQRIGGAVAGAMGPQRTLSGTLSGALTGMKRGVPEAAPVAGWLSGYAQSQNEGYNSPPTYGDLYPEVGQAADDMAATTLDPFQQIPDAFKPLMRGLVEQESNFNAKALGPKTKSGEQAIGLAQLMPGTAKELGVDPYHPVQNVMGGYTYITQQMAKFGDLKLALAAYNAGPGNVVEAMKKNGWSKDWDVIKKDLPKQTQDYVPSVIGKAKKYKGA